MKATVAKIRLLTNTVQAQLSSSPQLSILIFTNPIDHTFSLRAEYCNGSIPGEFGEALLQDNHFLFHSQLPSTLREGDKLLAIALLAVAFINPAKSRLFLR